MNRKKNITKLVLSLMVVMGIIGFSPSKAINLTIDLHNATNYLIDGTKIETSIRPVHFKEFQNDFGGLFYFKSIGEVLAVNDGDNPEEPEEPDLNDDVSEYQYTIEAGTKSVTCKNQIKGFYYNAERGERLWPIDNETKNDWHLDGLDMNGGIYTNCTENLDGYRDGIEACNANEEAEANEGLSQEECINNIKERFLDRYSYYGGVTHVYSGQKFVLAVGIKYTTGTIWIEPQSEIGRTFQRHPDEGSSLPFGLIYDNLGGVGFAGCEIVENASPATVLNDIIGELVDKEIKDLFEVIQDDETDEKKYLAYKRDRSLDSQRINCKDVGQDNDSALNILIEGLIGMGKENDIIYYKEKDGGKKALEKTQYFASANINNATLINYARQRAEILCRGKWTGSNNINTGINCKSGSQTLSESDRNKTIIVRNGDVTVKPFSSNTNDHYDIFIDSGNLIIDEGDAEKFVIKNNGFVYDTDISGFNATVQGIKDSTEVGPDMWSGLSYIGIASILKGNFIVNGHVQGAGNTGLNNKYFIYGKVTSLDNNDALMNMFLWRCNFGVSSDESFCPGPKVGGKQNPYQNAPLVIIDQNYNSPLLKY